MDGTPVTYLVEFSGGPCSGHRSIPTVDSFWFLKAGELWYYYRLEDKVNRPQTEEEVSDKKVNSVKTYKPFSRAKNRHTGARVHLPIQARYVYVPRAVQDMEDSHCDVVTFLAYLKREHGIEYNGE